MRPLIFAGDQENHRTAFHAIFSAWHFTNEQGFALVNTSANPQRAEAAITVQKAFDKLRIAAGLGQFTLRPEGGEMLLSEAQFDLLREFWEAFKKLPHPPSLVESVTTVDRYMANVPSVNEEEWRKVREREAAEAAEQLLASIPSPKKGDSHEVQGDGGTGRGG